MRVRYPPEDGHKLNYRKLLRGISAVCLLTANPLWGAELAVVIDDVGYNYARGVRCIELPGNLTVAILPRTPHAQQLSAMAADRGKDVIVHQPMEPYPSAHAREEDGTLKLRMSGPQFDLLVDQSLAALPQRVGLSNHTGSLLTQHRTPMRRLMQALQQRDLFFLDSRTTADTVALQVAREVGVPALRRDVFLDHERTTGAIDAAFQKALKLARKRGHAVLVGHPYPITLRYLEQRLVHLPEDIELVFAAQLARRLSATQQAQVLNRPAAPGLPATTASLHISPAR
ncbi:MAG: divergent polysaccharide deacetylase family protein [Pseudomonadota bacterium]